MDINSPTLTPTDTFVTTREEDLALPLHRALGEAAKAGRPDTVEVMATSIRA